MTERLLIRGGCVLTLGVKSSNFAQADVLVEGDRIVEVGTRIRARDAEIVDATDTIVMPGFVDTHRHAWKSLFRNLGDPADAEVLGRIGAHHRPDDVYAATSIGLLGAIETGITTVVDWSDIQVDQEFTDAVLQAHADTGMRTVFVHAAAPWAAATDPAAIDRLASRRPIPELTTVAYGPADPLRTEIGASTAGWDDARRHGLRIHVHAGRRDDDAGLVAELADQGRLGRDVTLVHCSRLDDADLDAIASSETGVAITPSTEMASGLGSPPMQRFIDRGIRPGLGVDDEHIVPGDLFAQMRAAISIQHGRHFDLKLAGKGALPNLLTTREVIRYATLDGARAVGLDALTGSLEVGKQADIVVLRTDQPNIHPINDPIGAVVWGMDSSNVDWVIAAGRVLVRDGVLEGDTAGLRTAALEAQRRVAVGAGLAEVSAR